MPCSEKAPATDLSNGTANIQRGEGMTLSGIHTEVWVKGQLKCNYITTPSLSTNSREFQPLISLNNVQATQQVGKSPTQSSLLVL